MTRKDDVSGPHFEWLVVGRSRNQRATLDLYRVIDFHQLTLEKDIALLSLADRLVGIAFSLWRAVFLSDLTGQVADQVVDLKKFLQSLIAHNAVLYQTDYSAREWTFGYYLENAIFRLACLPEEVLPPDRKTNASGSAKDDWTNAQAELELAIIKFAEMIADRPTL